jgi:hypothetical protein
MVEVDFFIRWNSLYWMITQAYKKKVYITKWVKQEISESTKTDYREKLRLISMNDEEWRCLRLLTAVLQPLVILTDALSRSREPSIYRAFIFYNRIIDSLQNHISNLQNDTENFSSYRDELAPAIESAITKLQTYYGRTHGQGGLIYNLATILDPSCRLEEYKVSSTCSLSNGSDGTAMG